MKCDTCGKEAETLRRVVIGEKYNAINRRPLWNCQVCYERKNKERKQMK